MKNTAICAEIGATPATPSEQLVAKVQARLVVSRRIKVHYSAWKLDLQSPFWRLYHHEEAGAYLMFNGRRQALRAEQLYLIPAWVHFSADLERDVIQDYIHFYLTGTPPSLARRVFDRPIELQLQSAGLSMLVGKWRATLSTRDDAGFTDLLWANALVQVAFASAVQMLPAAKRAALEHWAKASHPIGDALELIESDLSRPPSNAQLARRCGQSTDHFVRRFKAAIGLTPARYGIERRIAIATQWLIGSDKRIETIARDAGFADRFHFSRAFRSIIGMPPAQFRAAHLAK